MLARYRGREELRLAAAGRRQQPVDLLEDLLGLTLRRRRVAGDLPRDVDGVAVDDRRAHARPCVVTRDGHRSILSGPGVGMPVLATCPGLARRNVWLPRSSVVRLICPRTPTSW